MGDHTECIEIDYDPSVVSYKDLLDHFWLMHSGVNHGYKARQYLSLVLWRTEEERITAETKKKEHEAKKGYPIETEIAAFSHFTRAENYHQKFFLRRFNKAFKPLEAYFGSEKQLVDATASARLNAVAHGNLSMQEVYEEFNLDPELSEVLRSVKW
jgi:peptide-methionine (S)-S-oxide reductase